MPGHERFLTTTLAGVGPVPVALFVVAADDPWMPQAAEHLAALDALGVRHGVLAVTRSDLADPAPALARARDECPAPPSPAFPRWSAAADGRRSRRPAGFRGRAAQRPAAGSHRGRRLWVDRVFHVRGTGTVVTGTLPAARCGWVTGCWSMASRRGCAASSASVSRSRRRQRIARVAVALADPRDRARLLQGAGHGGRVRRRGGDQCAGPGRALPARAAPLHVGATYVSVHARPLGDHFARLRPEHPLPLRVGDRALLREPAATGRSGGVGVDGGLDPPAMRPRGSVARRAAVLETLDGTLAAEPGRPRPGPPPPFLGSQRPPEQEDSLVHGEWIRVFL